MTAYNNQEDIVSPFTCQNDLFSIANSAAAFLFPLPIAVTSFKNPSEALQSQIEACGYSKTSRGRYSFFEGVATPENIMKLAGLGGEMYTYAPQNRVNFAGHMAATIIRRLLNAAFRVTNVDSIALDAVTDLSYRRVVKPLLLRPSKFAMTDLTASGHFLPYFEGLTVPDYTTAHTVITLFGGCLGRNETKRTTSTSLLIRGWPSLSNTSTGKIISHLVFCLSIGFEGGFSQIRPVYLRGEYSGTLLIGRSSIIFNTKLTPPIIVSELTKEVAVMSPHDDHIARIIEYLNDCPLKEDKSKHDLNPDAMTHPRLLHYAASDRVVPPAVQAEIMKLLPSLRYRQTFLRPLDVTDLLVAVTAIKHGDRLDGRQPFDYLNGAFFTSSKTLSTLSAFGPIAPSPLNADGANAAQVLRPGQDPKKGTNKGTLEGLPIFGRPVQQAVEDWKTLKKTGAISYKVNGKNAFGFARIANLGTYVKDDTPDGKMVIKFVQEYSGYRKAEKRPSNLIETEDNDTARVVRTAKRRRVNDADVLFADLGWAAANVTPQEEMDLNPDDL